MKAIFDAIQVYASAYKQLEDIQRSRPIHLPRGDQKTGVIAEFYARLYAAHRFPNSRLEYGSTSEHAWDIRVVDGKTTPHYIQVKAVSAHAELSRVSPLHPGWNELWLMRLDDRLLPEGFWTYLADQVSWSRRLIKSSTMPLRGKPNSGSSFYRGGRDELIELWAALLAANPSIEGSAPGKSGTADRKVSGIHAG